MTTMTTSNSNHKKINRQEIHYTYILSHAHIHTQTPACLHTRMHAHTHANTHTHTCTNTHTHIHTNAIYKFSFIHTRHTLTHTSTHMHAHMHACTHTHMHTCTFLSHKAIADALNVKSHQPLMNFLPILLSNKQTIHPHTDRKLFGLHHNSPMIKQPLLLALTSSS